MRLSFIFLPLKKISFSITPSGFIYVVTNDKISLRLNNVPLCVCICAQSLGRVQLFVTPWTIARQVSLTRGFSRQEYWSWLPFPTSVYVYIHREMQITTHLPHFLYFLHPLRFYPYRVYLNNNFMNVRVQISLHNYFVTKGNQDMFRSWIAGSNVSSILKFRTIFYSACSSLHSNKQYTGITFSPHICLCLLSHLFLIIDF